VDEEKVSGTVSAKLAFRFLTPFPHPGGSPSRHPSSSIFNSIEGGKALRLSEIFNHWVAKGRRLIEVEPGVWVDPGF